MVSDFVSLKKSGKNYLGLCPFHAERTPSFTVNEEKGIFHCFGCGAGGNVFNFLMRLNNLSFPEQQKNFGSKIRDFFAYPGVIGDRKNSPQSARKFIRH